MKTVSRAGRSLMIEEPFYGFYLLNLNKKFSEEVPTAGVYKEGINMALAINKEFWNNLSENHQLGLLKHELLHICFFHLDMRDSYGDHALFNIAADLEINQYIKESHLPDGAIMLSSFPTIKLQAKQGTNYYYKKLQENLQLPRNPSSRLAQQSCGNGNNQGDGQSNVDSQQDNEQTNSNNSGSNNNNQGQTQQEAGSNSRQSGSSGGSSSGKSSGGNYRDENLDEMMQRAKDMHKSWKWYENLSSAEKKLIKQQAEHILKESAKNARKSQGSIPGELKVKIDELFETKEEVFNWKAYFRRFIGSSQEVYTRKSQRKLSKRFEGNPGLKIRKKKHILVAVDTSGSVSDRELAEFFSEIYHIWKCGSAVTIVECDAQIGDIYKYDGKFRGHVSGRGGTVFDPVIKYYNENLKTYTTLVYFTDGWASKPRNPHKQMMWVISSNGKADYAELPGIVIQIPPESK